MLIMLILNAYIISQHFPKHLPILKEKHLSSLQANNILTAFPVCLRSKMTPVGLGFNPPTQICMKEHPLDIGSNKIAKKNVNDGK